MHNRYNEGAIEPLSLKREQLRPFLVQRSMAMVVFGLVMVIGVVAVSYQFWWYVLGCLLK